MLNDLRGRELIRVIEWVKKCLLYNKFYFTFLKFSMTNLLKARVELDQGTVANMLLSNPGETISTPTVITLAWPDLKFQIQRKWCYNK